MQFGELTLHHDRPILRTLSNIANLQIEMATLGFEVTRKKEASPCFGPSFTFFSI
jgi:hypothetical protein